MTPFQYDRLDLSRDAIRLVRLVKGKAPEPIRCELYQTYLHKVDGVPYEALSYTWGDDDSSQSTRIILNGQEVCLRPNLHTALDFLRLEDSDRLLWIDAICIDQSYDKEKTHQVNQMRLVYTHAECVLFWLGPSGEHTNDLMDLITDIDRNLMAAKLSKKNWRLAIENTHNDYKIECEHWKVQAARDLVSRPWFSRVWILQEVASARRGTVICGRKSAPARTWALLMPVLLGRDLDDHTRAVLDIIPSPQRSESWWQKRRDLFTLLKKFAHSKSSDPKDKVYALIGISSDAGHNERFLPDYSADMQSFARNTISYILFGDVRSPEHIELPSWTVDALFRHQIRTPSSKERTPTLPRYHH
ncbi:hypothetical protein M406DRAFT_67992 [Cryphonectria parasitica EP155]|uniref:Heterokaryon incompatibility domain-containing protein n=1 Tax=Cryphonectria parasitica (strain ATCC 38755 / EP155) TaxID=660469 RepID=A0A9P4Y2V7_CRYP1|nr:uncharacterized protein M406DRAFT_67992 [Cryphonectria parasitica EP155]KAF3765566.1 hypothetical protein M406DRAFT_67992 [Cryphonectria parasitica EP155]